jgi:hypothetical protein
MNLWGFQPSVFDHLQREFNDFLRKRGNDNKAEFFIPFVVDELVESGQATVRVLKSHDQWFGITYRKDKPRAIARVNSLIKADIYPEKLWGK